MTTTLREGFVTGSGAVLDTVASVTVADTRVRGIHATGVGTFLITGVETDPYGNKSGTNIKFVLTTAVDAQDIILPEGGIVMRGPVLVSAPTSAATVAIFYG